MVRNYKRKTERGASKENIDAALKFWSEGATLDQTVDTYKISATTLKRHRKNAGEGYVRCKTVKMVFSEAMEQTLATHLKDLDSRFHGLTPVKCRELAYEYAINNRTEVKVPESWHTNKSAGKDWLAAFMKRHKLSIRTPEATSLARQSAFNRPAVNLFFDKLKEVTARFQILPQNIYNLDETGVTTVQNPGKVISVMGKKQVGATASQERGELVTMCCAVNAIGNSLPPFYIFPRVNMKQHFLNGAPASAKGVACKTGYMNSDIFTNEYLPFFISHAKPCSSEPTLLILDNHSSHISLQSIELCKEKHIILLTLPPHTSHRLQPLDRSVYGPLKRYLNSTMDEWQRSNPGRAITIYEMAQLSGVAFTKSVTNANIIAGFRATGIYPYNADIFDDSEFLPADVTDQPDPERHQPQPDAEPQPDARHQPDNEPQSDPEPHVEPQASTSTHPSPSSSNIHVGEPIPSTSAQTPIEQRRVSTSHITPEQLMPLPKAGIRQKKNTKRRKVASAILTDTPEKNRIAEHAAAKVSKQPAKRRKTAPIPESSDDDDILPIALTDSESGEDPFDPEQQQEDLGEITKGCYVLVKYPAGRKTIFYAGSVLDVKEDDRFEVNFLHKVSSSRQCAF
ncbi:uncharacterized protein [Watersipora subatra]|uniref:uncharacterized protein n=1 Tax=Watersipora subatra TaxID=2589382 RepID=UPI00355C1AA3